MVLWENNRNIWGYPVVICSIAMEYGPFIDDLAIKSLIFHSYVSLPDGKHVD